MTRSPGPVLRSRVGWAAAGVLAFAVLATISRAEDAPAAAGRVTEARLEAFLREAGYEPKDKTPAGFLVVSKLRREKRYENETLYVRVKVSEATGSPHVVLSSPPMPLPAGGKVPRSHLIDMLGYNAGDSGVAFCVANGELLYLMRFVDNRALLASALGLELEDFFDAIRGTVSVWDLSKESSPSHSGDTPPTPPAQPPAPMDGEGMR